MTFNVYCLDMILHFIAVSVKPVFETLIAVI